MVEVGDVVGQDETIANIETDKVTIPVNAPESGIVKELFAKEGDTVQVGSDLLKLELKSVPAEKAPLEKGRGETAVDRKEPANPVGARAADRAADRAAERAGERTADRVPADRAANKAIPAATAPAQKPTQTLARARSEQSEKMTRMRQRIAERMKESQATAASLTTFNEVDLSTLVAMRAKHKETFAKKHNGLKLGYMSAFVKASAQALQEIPVVNARMDCDANEIVYHNYVDISIAVATSKGLVTPVLRSCESMSFVQIERAIHEFGERARDGKMTIEDMAGGTFTISNGGVFGSMMGTPIINVPQSAILGMHAIKERPVAVDGRIEIRPMMYLALTYDHRLIDGREAVTFLVRVKEMLEDPHRLLLDV